MRPTDEPAPDRRTALAAGLTALAATATASADDPATKPKPLHERVCLFTDHLGGLGLSHAEVADHLKGVGVAGPDLTVRPGGLVPPDRAADELPKVAAALRDRGLDILMATTGLTSAKDPTARPVLAALGKAGVRYFKTGYYRYESADKWEAGLEAARKDLAGLAALGKVAGVQAGLHNHSGPLVGGMLWDAHDLLKPLDPDWVGAYFDPAHATIEGADFGWRVGFRRLASRLKMVAVKDFVWEKGAGGWKARWCPLGEGMVRWPDVFKLLAQTPFAGPVSLHLEYEIAGKTKAARLDNALAAAERDLKFLRNGLREAAGGTKK